MSAEEIEQLLQKYEFYLLPLIERGLIQKIEDTYQIFSTIFAWWIVRQLAAQSDIPSNAAHFPVEEEALLRAWQTLRKVAPQLTLDRLTTTLGTRVTKMATPPPLPQRYELQAEVGRGASGIVYKAFDTQLARPVAIKVLHPLSATPPADSRRRLLQEARAASQLQHPHIVTVYDVAETSGQIFLVMEYIGGRSLFDLLQEKQRLPLPEVIVLVEQAAAALDYAHSHEVIHRDIKPANLMLTANGELKLTDFGIAKIVGDPQTTHGTELKGTVIYMSPEQVNQKPLDGRSDLFSLATVTFQMLTGEPPWFGITVIQLMNNISDGDPRSLAAFDIADATLEAVLRKALAKNPADRYQRGADFVQALKQSAITDSSI
jgi:serine/threonine-protein kinase